MTADVEDDRSIDELMADPVVAKALHAIGQRLPNDPCPKCLEAPIAQNSPNGWCQPCDTHHEERIKASRRRSYHRRKDQVPNPDDTPRYPMTLPVTETERMMVADGYGLLTVKEAAQVLNVHPVTVKRWIREGRLRSLKLSDGARRIGREHVEEFLKQAEGDQETEEAEQT